MNALLVCLGRGYDMESGCRQTNIRQRLISHPDGLGASLCQVGECSRPHECSLRGHEGKCSPRCSCPALTMYAPLGEVRLRGWGSHLKSSNMREQRKDILYPVHAFSNVITDRRGVVDYISMRDDRN